MKISVVGLGKLGAVTATVFASTGFEVIGVDVDQAKVDAINSRTAPVNEPGLQELLQSANISATQSILDAVQASDVTFVITATPSEPSGKFSLKYVLPVCEGIGLALRSKSSFHTVVVTSTVMPGDCDGPIKQSLETASGLVCGEGFGLCYNPEFIALGSVIHDFLNPDFVLLGANDPLSESRIRSIYEKVSPQAPIKSMNRINAEITKLALNSFLTLKISYANLLARICNEVPGSDIDVITGAIGTDSRVGKKFLKGAVNYAGPCLPRDTRALATFCEEVDVPSEIPRTIDQFNRNQIKWLADIVETYEQPVALLGMVYKVGAPSAEESLGGLLWAELLNRGIIAFANVGDATWWETKTVVVALPDPKFRDLDYAGKTVIDCWRFLGHLKTDSRVQYVELGCSN